MHRTDLSRALTSGMVAGIALLAGGSGVNAQEAAAATSGEPATTVVLDRVVVTARRREEVAQDAPVSVSVVGEEDIRAGRVTTLEDAALRAPNVNFNGQGGPLSIRGVGSLGLSGGVDRSPAVGVFLDHVFLARPLGYPGLMEDLQRTEVVRGSQSILYGKNTIGGAVNLLSREPVGDRMRAELSATYGTDNEKRVKAAFETPIEGTGLAIRGVASWAGNDGYIHNSTTGGDVGDLDQLFGRFVISGDIGEATRLRVIGDFSRDGSDGGLWYSPLEQAFDHRTEFDFPAENEVTSGGLSVRIDHTLANAELTSITAVRGHEFTQFLDGDFSNLPYYAQGQDESQRQVSQELRLSSLDDGGPLRWTTGLFYMHERFDGTQFYDMVSLPRDTWSLNVFEQRANTWSAFGEVGYFLTEKLELSAGARLTYDRKETSSEIASPSGNFMMGMPGRAEDTASFTNLSPEVAATWHFSEGNIAYAKVSRGYKAGGISPYIEADGSANTYDPEETTTYEIGAKSTLLDGRLTLSAAGFFVDWQDQQAVIYMTPTTRVYRNAAAATSKGFEVEGAFEATDQLSFTAGYGYTRAAYDDFVDPIAGATYTGNPLPFAPEHSFNFGARWQNELQNGFTLGAGIDYAYRSSYSFTADNGYRQAPTHIVDAFAGISKDNWSATVWGKNLADESYLKNYFDFGGSDIGVAAPGRTFGVTLAAKW